VLLTAGVDGGWAICVTDNGVGLPQAERDRLTEPYVTTRAKGTGLGLAIVKKIIEDHGGTVTLEDGPESPDGVPQGAKVTLHFPVTLVVENSLPTMPRVAQAGE
jgi:two-component system nitrogen regulation sensor histidine kinase NtrY